MAARVRIYSTKVCPYCVRAKMLLTKRGIPYEEIDASDEATRDWLVQATGRKTVPQIFIAEQPIGGFDELAALDARGELKEMIGLV